MRSLAEARNERHDPSAPRDGELIAGRYQVEGVIGTGGMGRVVAARDEAGRAVAIKLLLSPPSERVWVERFFREARAVSRINSTHVVKVIAVSSPEEETPFIVMERLRGRDFGKRLRAEGPLGLRDVADCVVQACDALACSHQVGVVHRDVKPSNLFDHANPDGSHTLKVLDFGISKARGQEEFEHTLTTSRDGMLGSPPYMSPEHIRDARSVDHRTDIWSMGIVAYQLLAGRLPFDGQSVGEVFCAVLERRFAPLSKVRPDLPPTVEAIINRCLAREPHERYQSAAELARAFAPFASPRLAAVVNQMPTATPAVTSGPALVRSTPLPSGRLDGEVHTLTLPPIVPMPQMAEFVLTADEAPATEPSLIPIGLPIDPIITTTDSLLPFDDLSAASLATAKKIRRPKRGVALAALVAVGMFGLMAIPFVLSGTSAPVTAATAIAAPAPPAPPPPPVLEALPFGAGHASTGPAAPAAAQAEPTVIATPRPTPAPFAGGRQVLRGRPRGKPAPHPQAEAKPERAPEPAKTEAPAPRPELHPNPYGM